MKKTKKIASVSALKNRLAEVKINPKLESISDAPFIKKKIAKVTKIINIAGLPK